MRHVVLIVVALTLGACTSLDRKSLTLEPGMTKEQVLHIMGPPSDRSFRGTDEALQYQGVVGFGECIYITTWFKQRKLVAVTQRRGSSAAGCSLGSREIDWGQMPKPTINVNVKHET